MSPFDLCFAEQENRLKRPKIFVCNDDGIHSPGLRAAVEAALPLGDVLVVAPSQQQTAMGRGFRGDRNERLHRIEFPVNGHAIEAYHCDCSPALLVEHGVNILGEHHPPDLLISGINYGENLGSNVTMSGTVGAALQGACMGIPGLAVSLQTELHYHFNYGEVDWSIARYFLRVFAEKMLSRTLPDDVDVLKVDVPAEATQDTPCRLTRVSRQMYYSTFVENPSKTSTLGETKLHVNIDKSLLEKDSDIHALFIDGVVSVTPISLDLTSRIELNSLAGFVG